MSLCLELLSKETLNNNGRTSSSKVQKVYSKRKGKACVTTRNTQYVLKKYVLFVFMSCPPV